MGCKHANSEQKQQQQIHILLELLVPTQLFPSISHMLTLAFFFSPKFICFNWRLISLQYCSGFCHSLTWISHGCTCVPHPEPLSYVPPHPIPQGHQSARALSILSHASNLDWWSISHLVIYMFQCHSLKWSHPCLLPESKSLFFISVSLSLSCV